MAGSGWREPFRSPLPFVAGTDDVRRRPVRRSLTVVRLTVIGCSGSFPGPDSPGSCYLVEADGFRLLLDLGNGALGALQRYCGLYDVDAICLSHLHADHCLDPGPEVRAAFDFVTLAPGSRGIGPFQVTTDH